MKGDIEKWANRGLYRKFPRPVIINSAGPIAAGKTEFLKAIAKILNIKYVEGLHLDASYFEELEAILKKSVYGTLTRDDAMKWAEQIEHFQDCMSNSKVSNEVALYFANNWDGAIKYREGVARSRGTLYVDELELIALHDEGKIRYSFNAPGAHEKAEKVECEDVFLYYLSLEYLLAFTKSFSKPDFAKVSPYSPTELGQEPHYKIAVSILSSLYQLSKRIGDIPCIGMISHADKTEELGFIEESERKNPSGLQACWADYARNFCELFLDWYKKGEYDEKTSPELVKYVPPQNLDGLFSNIGRIEDGYLINSRLCGGIYGSESQQQHLLSVASKIVETHLAANGLRQDFKFVSFHPDGHRFGSSNLTVPFEWIE